MNRPHGIWSDLSTLILWLGVAYICMLATLIAPVLTFFLTLALGPPQRRPTRGNYAVRPPTLTEVQLDGFYSTPWLLEGQDREVITDDWRKP
jgi:hypothetical protein